MPDPWPDDSLRRRRATSQAALVEFLSSDLDIAFTMLDTARIEVGTDPEHCKRAIAKARTVLDTVRRLLGRVEDPHTWTAVHRRTDELEAALADVFKLAPPDSTLPFT